ncbi:MAG TPA: hypothetical protein GX708_22110 [Gallicola sp.]|nr:hypothetical protein [Gallicola sp.]
MKKKVKKMDIVFLLDRSGSMSGMENDTIGGYNSYLDSQRKDNIKVTTILYFHHKLYSTGIKKF